jgi:hypothetical protein
VLHTPKQVYKKEFEDLTTDEKVIVEDEAEEWYFAYVMLQNSSINHGKLKAGLVDDYAKGQDHIPKNQQAILHLLDKHSKTTKSKQTSSEGHTFVTQKGGKGAKKATSKPIMFNPADWTNKTCFVCGKKSHPSCIHCKNDKTERSEKSNKGQSKPKKKDDSSQSNKSSKSSSKRWNSLAGSKTNVLRKTFTTLARELTALAEGGSILNITDPVEESKTYTLYLGGQQSKSTNGIQHRRQSWNLYAECHTVGHSVHSRSFLQPWFGSEHCKGKLLCASEKHWGEALGNQKGNAARLPPQGLV